MQLGIRLHDVVELPLEERVKKVADLGFKCGHLAIGKFVTDYPFTDEALTPGYAMYLKNLFLKNNVDIAVLGCYLNLATPNKEQLAETTHRYMAHIRFASHLGCGVIGTETGAPNETYTFVPESHSEAALQAFIKNLRPVVEYAEQMGVIVAIEPVWRHIVYTPKIARRVLDEINSPNLQIILDPVNLLDISNVDNYKEIIDEAIEVLGEDVAMVHLKDFDVIDDKLVSMGCGLGKMDYSSILTFMKKRKPFIHATLEDTKPENCIACRDYIQKMYDSI